MKKLLAILCTTAVLLSFSACNDDEVEQKNTDVETTIKVTWNEIKYETFWSDDLLYFVVPVMNYEDSQGVHEEEYTGSSNKWTKSISLTREVAKDTESVTEKAFTSYRLKENTSVDMGKTYYFTHVLDVTYAGGTFEKGINIYVNNSIGYPTQPVAGPDVDAFLRELVSKGDTVFTTIDKNNNISVAKR